MAEKLSVLFDLEKLETTWNFVSFCSVKATIIMRVGHVFVGLIFLWVLPVSECPVNNVSLTSRHLTSCCNLGAYFPSSNIILGGRNRSFLDRLSVPLEFLDSLYCDHNNSYGVGSNEPLCLWNLDAEIKMFSHILSCGYAKTRFALLFFAL